ncbi:MAG: CRISPR-associated protein Cas5 [Candidatus Aminicenantes bacterium]|nr:MAG: CRISPR-associated protein Cas5 [Candidatus Aminicenantes bacterium]
MEYVAIEVNTQTATFRIPEFQNFHKSFTLPPPTTLMGLAGAALGLSPGKTQEFFDASIFELGVTGVSKGRTRDLWKYRKLKSGGYFSDIITREVLFFNTFYICYGSDDKNSISSLRSAFRYPVFATTLGSSDSLAKVTILEDIELSESNQVTSCLLAGNIIKEVLENSDNNCEFSIYSSREPICYDLPVRFRYASDYGIRSVVKRGEFSFIGKPMKLNVFKKGIKFKDVFIPLFRLG